MGRFYVCDRCGENINGVIRPFTLNGRDYELCHHCREGAIDRCWPLTCYLSAVDSNGKWELVLRRTLDELRAVSQA